MLWICKPAHNCSPCEPNLEEDMVANENNCGETYNGDECEESAEGFSFSFWLGICKYKLYII